MYSIYVTRIPKSKVYYIINGNRKQRIIWLAPGLDTQLKNLREDNFYPLSEQHSTRTLIAEGMTLDEVVNYLKLMSLLENVCTI